jgi:hypothetical protein
MPNTAPGETAPGAERLAGGVGEGAAAAPARRGARAWRWAGVALFLLVVVVLFDAYLHLSKTYPENSDEANILLMADDMLHGNVSLSGWNVSDVPFMTTELPQIAVLVALFGLHLNTAHIAAAMTYTLAVAVGMLLAKGRAHGWAAVARMALVLGIMIAPQPGVGIFVMIFSVGHIGTAVPVMLTWLVIDRLALPSTAASLRRRWYVPLIVAVLLAWALMADPLVLVVAIYPMLAVCLIRLVSAVVGGTRDGGLAGAWQGVLGRWLELSLAAAAGISYAIVLLGRQLLQSVSGYNQQPVKYAIDATRTWFWHARVVVHGLLEMFGAYFVPGQDPQYPMSRLDEVIAVSHLVGVVLAVWGACAIARRMFFRDADFISQLLLAGIVANLFAYIPSTLADNTALNTREIAPVLPFAAVLAARMLGDRLVSGPVATVRLPRFGRPGAQGAPGAAAPARSLAVRLVAVPLIALFGWYSFGLFRQADTPAAPQPLAQLAAFLEANHLHYGLSGYWDASVLTVETGGAVTVRAVTSACLQPYPWESENSWYDPRDHYASFILLSSVKGYFSQFSPSGDGLLLLKAWSRPPYVYSRPPAFLHSKLWPAELDFGGYFYQLAPVTLANGKVVMERLPFAWYNARVYPINLLSYLPKIATQLNNPPSVVCS